MNDRIRKLFEESGMSKYALAQAAGVPYTTVSEILNEKIDINRCAAESVSRLAEVLGAKTEDVLNRSRVMEDAGGTYRGIRYRWQYNGECMELRCKYRGESFVIDMHREYDMPGRRVYYESFAKMWMDVRLEEKAFEKRAGKLLEDVTDAK